MLPALLPLYVLVMDCAASSITAKLCFSATAIIGSMSAI